MMQSFLEDKSHSVSQVVWTSPSTLHPICMPLPSIAMCTLSCLHYCKLRVPLMLACGLLGCWLSHLGLIGTFSLAVHHLAPKATDNGTIAKTTYNGTNRERESQFVAPARIFAR